MLSEQFPVILPAVIRPRRRAEIFTRQRLLDRLYDLMERKLILVVAPAGYGKTSLLIDFVHQKEIRACWYSVDQHDHSLRRFLAHFIASIARLYPTFGRLSYAALQRLDCLNEDVEHLVTTIINELFESVSEHFVIVLDDFHVIGDQPAILHFISRFVSRVDENCHLLIASRRQLDLPDLELMIARGQAGGINFQELAFTPAEIQSLAQKQQLRLSYDQASALAEQTEGWITAILLTPSLPGYPNSIFLPGIHAAGAGLAAYWDLLLNQQSQAMRDFLLYSSVLDEFNAGICKTVLSPILDTPDAGWENLLKTVLHDNLFVMPAGEDGGSLRYHSLFQEHLQKRLECEHPGAVKGVLRQIVQMYKARDNWERAYQTSRRLNDQAATLEIIEQAGPTLLKYERINTLVEWLESVPDNLLSARPGLVSLQGMTALMGGNIRRGLELLNRAEAALRLTSDRECLARTLVRRSTGHYYLGHYPDGLLDANEALEVVGDDDSLLTIKGMALRARGVCKASMNCTVEGLKDIQQALAIFQSLEDWASSTITYQELGNIYRSIGDFDAARSAYMKAQAFWRTEDNSYRLADLLNNLGVFYHHLGDYERAAATFNEGLSHARLVGFARLEAFILTRLGDLYADLMVFEDAELVFEQAWDIARRIENRFLCFYIPFALAGLARAQNDLERAHCLHSQAVRFAEPGSHLEAGLLAMQAGRLALVENHLEDALQEHTQAVEHFHAGKLNTEEVKAHCYFAEALLSAGDSSSSLAHLKRAFMLIPPAKIYIVFLDATRSVIPVLEYAVRDPELGSKTTRLLERLQKFEATLPEVRRKLRKNVTTSLAARPKIVIRTLGGMQIHIHDQAFDHSAWQSRVQRELFFYLLHNRHAVTKESLLERFWPGPDSHSNLLTNAIYKIRRLLGDDILLYQDGGYKFNRGLDYEYDVEEFLTLAAAARQESDCNRRKQIYYQMLQLYRGDFLPEADGNWVVAEREYLRQLHIKALLELGEYHLLQNDYTASMRYCWQVYERDPCSEEGCRLAMRVAAAMGNRATIAQYYELGQRALAQNSQAKLSDETHQLYRQLMR